MAESYSCRHHNSGACLILSAAVGLLEQCVCVCGRAWLRWTTHASQICLAAGRSRSLEGEVVEGLPGTQVGTAGFASQFQAVCCHHAGGAAGFACVKCVVRPSSVRLVVCLRSRHDFRVVCVCATAVLLQRVSAAALEAVARMYCPCAIGCATWLAKWRSFRVCAPARVHMAGSAAVIISWLMGTVVWRQQLFSGRCCAAVGT